MKHTYPLIGLLAFSGISVDGQAQGVIENPQPNSPQSGVTVVSGWHCNANILEIQIDGGRFIPVAYGTERRDTIPVCGDADNGFGFLINYNALGDGAHTISAFADGVEFGSVDFTVSTLGEEFARGLEKEIIVPAFPDQNVDVILRWQEASQNFQIAGVQPGGTLVGFWADGFSPVALLVFGSDGTYATDACDGYEAGTYVYDPAAQQFTSIVVTQDNNGECGLADNGVPYLGSDLRVRREGTRLVINDGEEIWYKIP